MASERVDDPLIASAIKELDGVPAAKGGVGPLPQIVIDAVLASSKPGSIPAGTPVCRGVDWSRGTPSLEDMLKGYLTTGFQATNLGLAIDEINRMRAWRLSDVPVNEKDDEETSDPAFRAATKAKIFLSFTSNMISSGTRETIKELVKHKMVDVIVSTAGGIEEDFMKCLADTYLGDFALKGRELRMQGINRIGNLLVPNDNYCKFEDWLGPLLHTMTDEQVESGAVWTPSRMIKRMGLEIKHEDSVFYWAAKNDIPVFCPALTDGSVGDMIYFHSYKRPEFVLDIARDVRAINDEAVHAHATGMIILGGGLVKHHTCNANLMRNGANFAVFVNTGQEFDGSDSGARPDEAISWGKIRIDARPVKVYCDATLALPLIVSQTFAKDFPKADVDAASGVAPGVSANTK